LAGQDTSDFEARALRDVASWTASARGPVHKWLVLDAGPNPSTDYYVRPRLTAVSPVIYRTLGVDRPRPGDLAPGTFVIVVRTLSPRWAYALAQSAAALAGFAYFMDDDLWDPRSHVGLPLGYRWRLARRALLYAPLVRARADHLWVSTPTLARKYANAGAALLPPVAPDEPPRAFVPTGERVRIVYHGSRAHLAEMRWLLPVLRDVLAACPHVDFEAIGGAEVQALFRPLPRTRVLAPMSWPAYRAHAAVAEAHIGLAPLLPSRFNASRSATKRFDHARLGAMGVYSQGGPYDDAVTHDHDGLLLPLDPARWTRELTLLATDRPRLDRLRRAGLAPGR
jgi:hypothetical protein